jgi:signal transduction histidine kinase
VLQGFIQDFYEISRIEGDDYPFLPGIISVQGMLKETAVAYYHDFESKKIEVTVDLEEMPACIIADKIQFNRIINNLLQNALKYADRIFILKQFSVKDICILQFINDRNKISEDEIKMIFERFYTGDQSRNSQSTGLGLTITKLLVEKMKGTIEARIEEEHFIIELRWPLKY